MRNSKKLGPSLLWGINSNPITSWNTNTIRANSAGEVERLYMPSKNVVSTANFSGMKALSYLSISSNKGITSLNASGASLSTLYANFNPIKTATYGFDHDSNPSTVARSATVKATSADGRYVRGGSLNVQYAKGEHKFSAKPDKDYGFIGWFRKADGKRFLVNSTWTSKQTTSFDIQARFIAKPSGIKVINQSTTTQKISWSKVVGASGYQVYRKSSTAPTYVLAKTITSPDILFFTQNATAGRTYTYKVRAYYASSATATKKYSPYSVEVSRKLIPPTPAITSITPGLKQTTLKWGAISGASGYTLYRSDTATGIYKAIKSVTTTSTTNGLLTSGKTYYYKIRAYRAISGVKVYSLLSAYKSVTVK